MRIFMISVALVAMAGCQSYSYSKAGFSEAEFNQNTLECQAMARRIDQQGGQTAKWALATENDPNFTTCMRSKGYSLTPR
jgi:hypothetical protein